MTTEDLTRLLFDRFNIRVNGSSLHPLDQDLIKGTLKEFIDKGYDVDAELFRQLAISQGWHENSVKLLVEKSQQLMAGGNIQQKFDKEGSKLFVQKILNDYPNEFNF